MTNSNFAHFMPDENEDESTIFLSKYQQLFLLLWWYLRCMKIYREKCVAWFCACFLLFCLLLSEHKLVPTVEKAE